MAGPSAWFQERSSLVLQFSFALLLAVSLEGSRAPQRGALKFEG